MAEAFEGEVKFKGLEEAARDFRELENRINGTSESMGGASGASSNMAQNITAGVVAAQAAIAVFSKLAAAVGEAAAEFERQSGILNRFNGDISEASDRTNGLITSLDLMTARSRANAAGLELTSSQFATLAVRASEFAAATGGDATDALNRLVQAVATGRQGALKELGVDLEGITDQTEKTEEAIRQLTEGFEDAESSADTFGGRLQVLENELDDMTTEMISAVNDSGLLEESFDNLADATRLLFGEIDIFGAPLGPLSSIETFALTGAAMLSAFSQQVEAVAEGISAMMEMIADPTNLSAAQRFLAADANVGFEAFDRQVSEAQRRGAQGIVDRRGARANAADAERAAREARSSNRRRSGGSGGRNDPEELKEQIDLQKELAELRAREQEAEERLLENNQLKGEAAAELAKAEQERLALLEQQTAEAQKQKQLIIEQREAEQERQALMKRATRVQDGITQGLDGIASITKKTIELTEEGGMSAKDAFVTATDEWLKQFAISEAWKGAAAGIEAIGAVIMNAPHAAAKAAEAAGHFALAAAAGGASAAIPNAAGAPPADTGASRPEAAGGQNTGGGGGMYVVNFNAPTADSQLGALQNRMDRAATRRFGT